MSSSVGMGMILVIWVGKPIKPIQNGKIHEDFSFQILIFMIYHFSKKLHHMQRMNAQVFIFLIYFDMLQI